MNLNRKQLAGLIIGGCFALTQFSLALYLPALPVLTHVFHSSSRLLMLSLSFATLGYACGQLVWGSLSDYIGRRPVYIISLIIYIIICFLILNTTTLLSFYINMTLLGFCASTYTGVGNALTVDILGRKKARIGIAYIGITMSAASVINPLIGSQLLVHFGWQAIYMLLLIYSSAMLISFVLFVPETHKVSEEPKQNLFKVYKKLFTHPQYMGYLIVLGLNFGCFFAYLAAAPFIYKHILHATESEYGWLFLASGLTFLLGSIFVRYRINQWGFNKLLLFGLLCVLIGNGGLLLMNFLHFLNRYSMTLPIAIFMLGLGIIFPSAKAGAMSIFEHHRGTAAALMKFTQIGLTVVITALAAGLHLSNSITLLGTVYIAIAVVALVCLKRLVLQKSIPETTK